MAGALSITNSDTGMLVSAMLVGVTMYFPLAFRLKFRFTNKICLIASSLVLIIVNIIVPMIESLPILIVLCFIAGFFRLFGTFECLSSMLPKIAPTHNYSVFLSFVFFMVLGFVHIFDIVQVRIIFYYNWHYIHYCAIGFLLINILIAWFLMKNFRPMPLQKLLGIDYLGMFLWSVFILSLIFTFQYGKELDWIHSVPIRASIGISMISLALNLWRLKYIRHPFLEIAAFKARNLWNLLLLFLFLDILLSSQHILQNVFVYGVLHIDSLNASNLYYFEILGMLFGAIFSWFALTKLKWTHKMVCFCGMLSISLYLVQMMAIISPNSNIEKLYLPLIFCGFGHVVVFISLTVYAQATAPFKNYFQVLCILGLVRTGIGSALGDALFEMALEHYMLLNASLTISLREIYGLSIIFAVIVLILISISRFKKHAAMLLPTPHRIYWSMFHK
jgi:hypothetical protein